MVKNSIKVYARLKKEFGKKKLATYVISRRDDEYEDIVFPHNQFADATNNKYQKYRFRRVFDQESGQSDIFDVVAKPIINSVINGFNGTVLAYGQTGSGKTFAITGSPTKYEDRGIIPRSIQQIFESMNCSPNHFTVYISYLEIYHEIGYDLLNPNQQPSLLEELPRVVLLEDAHGEAHLRNLSVLPVSNEQEAMRLLFLGDTNRTIAETPMNEYSSRSHCIFTIYITTRSEISGKIRRSKLNLVDLAGSERINKSNISGIALNEAKHINLSLHYLEQVIFALSQPNRPHIPFRNSMMTYILRDSLSGNSLTAMLATLAITQKNLEETITTCKFAQRVACISTEAVINEEIDPQREIIFLRNELDELRRRLTSTKGTNSSDKLTLEQEDRCKRAVKNYLRGSDDIGIDLDITQVKLCFDLFKEQIKKKEKSDGNTKRVNAEIMEKYMSVIKEKDEEISTLKELLALKPASTEEKKKERLHTDKSSTLVQIKESLTSIEKQALEVFMMDQNNKKELCTIQNLLDQKYSIAGRVASTIQKCQSNIVDIRKKLKANTNNREITGKLRSFLLSQQNVYRESILQLQALKNETDYLKQALEQAEVRVFQRFKDWIDSEINESGNGRGETIPEKDIFKCVDDCSSFINQTSWSIQDNTSELIKNDSRKYYSENSLCTNQYDKSNTRKLLNNLESEPVFLEKYKNRKALSSLDESFSANTALENNLKSSGIPSQNILIQQPSVRNGRNFESQRNNILFPSFEEKVSSVRYCQQFRDTPRQNNFLDSYAINDDTLSFDVCSKDTSDYLKRTNFADENIDMNQRIPVREDKMLKVKDSAEFIEFMKSVPLTGDAEVDDEIFNFYRKKLKLNADP